jgi:hypothetical protein
MRRHRVVERCSVAGPFGRYGASRLAEVQCVVRNWYGRHIQFFLNHGIMGGLGSGFGLGFGLGFGFHRLVPGAEV